MAANWEIRKATPTDAEGLKGCMQNAYSIYRERMGEIRLPPMDVDYSTEIKNYPCWVVESEDRIVAGLIMQFENDQASIANIAVAPGNQGQGIGGALIKFAVTKASMNGFAELHLATHPLLTENISLYRHLGWVETNRDAGRVNMVREI